MAERNAFIIYVHFIEVSAFVSELDIAKLWRPEKPYAQTHTHTHILHKLSLLMEQQIIIIIIISLHKSFNYYYYFAGQTQIASFRFFLIC